MDGHGHFPGESQIDLFNVNLNCPPLGPVVNMDDLVRLLKVKADNTKAGDWVQGSNYDDSMIAEKRHPNRDDLDKASTQHPVMAMHSSSHMCAVNSYVIEREIMPKGKIVGNEFILKDTGKAVDGVEIKDGRLTGMLYETNAMGLFTRPSLSTAQSLQLTARGSQAYAAAGVTTSDQGASMLASLPAYQNSVGNKDLNIRIILHPLTFAYGGVSNHAFLKWDTNNTPDPFDDAPTAASPKVGDDLTRLVVGQNDPSALPENYLLSVRGSRFMTVRIRAIPVTSSIRAIGTRGPMPVMILSLASPIPAPTRCSGIERYPQLPEGNAHRQHGFLHEKQPAR